MVNLCASFYWRLGFLEPPAFEEGILERYPIFLDLVLNHISGDSVVFSHAVTCLRLLFEMLGEHLLFFQSQRSICCLMLSWFLLLMFWAPFKVVSFGWGLHCLLVWCATLYWVSVSILEMRKAIKTFLIFFSLFCRHVSGPLYHFIFKSFANVSLNILFFWLSYMLGIFYWHYWYVQIQSIQSLEALQDGEHEKQRRNFLYFLLHQVPVSSNFSVLTRKKACQVLFSTSRFSNSGHKCGYSHVLVLILMLYD
jgi:hypothetical protein